MSAPIDAPWPPSDELLAWRPPASSPTSSVPGWVLTGNDQQLPSWVALPAGVEPDAHGDIDVPAYELANVETDAGRPGGGGMSSVYAVPMGAGGFRIVITNDDEIPFESPIAELAELPTLGELLRILDETLVDGEVHGIGHPTRVYSDSDHRERLRRLVTVHSALYPALEQLDRSRLEQWIAERP